MIFGENRCRVKIENTARNVAMLCRITLNLLKRDTNTSAELKIRRLEGVEAAQALAGHTTAQMTAHYTKAREVERVAPVSLQRVGAGKLDTGT
ncbi:hypothetical protein [Paraburkholderia lacunae]|uniref:Uncharacterized protein n=1 Tax=Paraburkholderia lacunae TaxID=2211104 RepID=A0A370N3X8_9BURK|nr:hypothetical protein [Paraburkholderia lacunae]RDK00158.1 hypothetical protein DLM46_24500 [Paraburkholderia lacunae]